MAEDEVLAQAAGEQVPLLRDDAELLAKRPEPHRAQLVIVDPHLALLGVVQAGDKLGQRGLSGPRRADQRDGLARVDVSVTSWITGMPGA